MEYDNLTKAEKVIYNRTITTTSHRRRVELTVTTLDDVFVRMLTPRITEGSVTIDVKSKPSRVATLKFLDPSRTLVFEPKASGDSPMHRSYKCRIVDSRQIPDLDNQWIDQVLINGPIWDFDRVGALVSLTIHGTERLAMGTIRKAHVYLRKTRMTKIITRLLRAAGSRDMRIPDLPKTTSVHVHVGVHHVDVNHHEVTRHTRHVRGFTLHRADTYWDRALVLAEALNRHLFPDADGVFELRTHPERSICHIRAALLADVELDRPGDDGPNTWVILGAKPKGSKRRVSSGLIGFPHKHPLSASELAWHDEPYQVLEQTSNPHIKTIKGARAVGRRKRDRGARLLVDVTIESLPIPWLAGRELDMVTAQDGWGVVRVVIQQLTYPIGRDDTPMTIGSVRRRPPRYRHAGKAGVS